MEETGTLEKTNSLDSLLPDGEPGPLSLPLPYGPPELPPDLAALVAAWPTLPERIRADIVAMVKAAEPGKRGGR